MPSRMNMNALQAMLTATAGFDAQPEQSKLSEANIKYHIARAFTTAPFAAPPHARNGLIVVQGEDTGYGKLKASEAGRLLRTLPHILDSVSGNERTIGVLAMCRCAREPLPAYTDNIASIPH